MKLTYKQLWDKIRGLLVEGDKTIDNWFTTWDTGGISLYEYWQEHKLI